jgi:ESF2/ABP1 family protein
MGKREAKGESEEEGQEYDEAENAEEEDDEEEEDEEVEHEEEEDKEEGIEVAMGEEDAGTARVKGPINMKKLTNFKDKLEKTGVVYLSRVPPYMKAQKIRQLLSKYGEIGRIYLTPEDPAIRKKVGVQGSFDI